MDALDLLVELVLKQFALPGFGAADCFGADFFGERFEFAGFQFGEQRVELRADDEFLHGGRQGKLCVEPDHLLVAQNLLPRPLDLCPQGLAGNGGAAGQ